MELLKCADSEARIEQVHSHTSCTFAHIALPRLNRRITLVQPPKTVVRPRKPTENEGEESDASRTEMLPHLMATLDLAKVAHVVLFLHGSHDASSPPISDVAHTLISALFAQGQLY